MDLTIVIGFNHKWQRFDIWHAYFNNKALLYGIKVNDLVILNVSFMLKIAFCVTCKAQQHIGITFLNFAAARGIVFYKHILIILIIYAPVLGDPGIFSVLIDL